MKMIPDEQDLKDMKLHENKTIGYTEIQRVFGGWIYWRASRDKINIPTKGVSVSCAIAGVFVPEP